MILMCPCTYNRFHLFFLIQSILLFHDRRFFQLVLYMYDYNDKNTVGKHLFFLIQSILLFHDRCCFTFCFSSSYICTITMTKIQLENIYFSYSKYIIFYQYQNNLPAVHTYTYILLRR